MRAVKAFCWGTDAFPTNGQNENSLSYFDGLFFLGKAHPNRECGMRSRFFLIVK